MSRSAGQIGETIAKSTADLEFAHEWQLSGAESTVDVIKPTCIQKPRAISQTRKRRWRLWEGQPRARTGIITKPKLIPHSELHQAMATLASKAERLIQFQAGPSLEKGPVVGFAKHCTIIPRGRHGHFKQRGCRAKTVLRGELQPPVFVSPSPNESHPKMQIRIAKRGEAVSRRRPREHQKRGFFTGRCVSPNSHFHGRTCSGAANSARSTVQKCRQTYELVFGRLNNPDLNSKRGPGHDPPMFQSLSARRDDFCGFPQLSAALSSPGRSGTSTNGRHHENGGRGAPSVPAGRLPVFRAPGGNTDRHALVLTFSKGEPGCNRIQVKWVSGVGSTPEVTGRLGAGKNDKIVTTGHLTKRGNPVLGPAGQPVRREWRRFLKEARAARGDGHPIRKRSIKKKKTYHTGEGGNVACGCEASRWKKIMQGWNLLAINGRPSGSASPRSIET